MIMYLKELKQKMILSSFNHPQAAKPIWLSSVSHKSKLLKNILPILYIPPILYSES